MHKDLASFLELSDDEMKAVKASASTAIDIGVVKEVDPTAGSTAVTRDTKEGDNDEGSAAVNIGYQF